MKRRKHHAKSILQTDRSRCYLCRLLDHDDSPKETEEHHIFFGPLRDRSEEQGLKVYLCARHHRTGPDAVHRNIDVSRRLQQIAQRAWEQEHSHEEWMDMMKRNYIELKQPRSESEELFESFKEQYPNLARGSGERKIVGSGLLAVRLRNNRIILYDDRGKTVVAWRDKT